MTPQEGLSTAPAAPPARAQLWSIDQLLVNSLVLHTPAHCCCDCCTQPSVTAGCMELPCSSQPRLPTVVRQIPPPPFPDTSQTWCLLTPQEGLHPAPAAPPARAAHGPAASAATAGQGAGRVIAGRGQCSCGCCCWQRDSSLTAHPGTGKTAHTSRFVGSRHIQASCT